MPFSYRFHPPLDRLKPSAVVWFRRDLRTEDHAALSAGLSSGLPLLGLFIFDPHLLQALAHLPDRRLAFIDQALKFLRDTLTRYGIPLLVFVDHPLEVFRLLTTQHLIRSCFCNRDDEPYPRQRDLSIQALLHEQGIPFHQSWDHLLLPESRLRNAQNQPFRVFSAFKRRFLAELTPSDLSPFSCPLATYAHDPQPPLPCPPPESIGANLPLPPYLKHSPEALIQNDSLRQYGSHRDVPSSGVASRIGIHLRFGTISIRAVARVFQSLDETLFTQLIWREFFFGILYRDPSLSQKAYAPWGNHLEWENDPKKFEAWKSGHTGFPLVDAGMRQLAQTGEIHNRVRMVVASFLVKNALIDWRWGERHFAQTLLDYDMALNNGNWQWCAGTGVDAAPYFRVFNPESQRKKFDPDGRYCRQWVKEWGTVQYPQPILDLALTRQRAIETFRRAREGHPQAITADAQPCPF